MIPTTILLTILSFVLGTICNYYSIVVFKFSLTLCGVEVLLVFFTGMILLVSSGLLFYAFGRCIEKLKDYKYYK